jgi:hypothetical protein
MKKLKPCKPAIMQHSAEPGNVRLVMSRMDDKACTWTPEKGSAAYKRIERERDKRGGYIVPMEWTPAQRQTLKEYRENK